MEVGLRWREEWMHNKQSKLFLILILGSYMEDCNEGGAESESGEMEKENPNMELEGGGSPAETPNRHLAFEKNYPKNIFIPLIEHLGEVGLRREYEACVGTRESFEGKNVVSLAEIHAVLRQEWFRESINLPALLSNMSNKILMNSKIKKKLFHLLLLRELFSIPLHDPKSFKKIVSKKANEVSLSKLPTDDLFTFPSALIYLLSLFSQGLSDTKKPTAQLYSIGEDNAEESKNYLSLEQNSIDGKSREKEISSKQEYKHYISTIVTFLNTFHGESSDLLDILQQIKGRILAREEEVRVKYGLALQVPEWRYFGSTVIDNCYLHKRNRGKLTFSMINQWIQQFKDQTTTLKGFLNLPPRNQEEKENYQFHPIVLIFPPH